MANIEQKFREACKQSGLASMLNQLNNAALNGLLRSTLDILKQNASGNTVIGTIRTIGNTVNVSKQREFLKRELTLDCSRFNPEDGTKIESFVSVTFTQKHCADLDGYAVGERVEVKFRLGGREWNGKVINDVTGYAIERVDVQQPVQAAQAPQAAPQQPAAPVAPQTPQAVPQAAPQEESPLPF